MAIPESEDIMKPILTPKEYQTQFVDFYSQTLGKTGIDAGDNDDDDDNDDKTDDKDVNIQAAPISGDDETFVSYSTMGSDKFTEPDVEMINLQNVVATDYKDLLDKDNVKDLTNFDSFGITFSKPSTSTFKKAGTTIGLAKVLSPTMSLMGADLVGSMFGDERKEIDGKTGFRPSGGLGLAYDMNMSNQAANINASKQAVQANKIESERARIEGRTPNLKGEGFYARIDGQLVSRHPGKTYYDGVYNYTPEQLKNMEALRKGFNPSGYNLIKETGSESIINTSATRGYTERGSFVSINGSAATGLQRDLENLKTASDKKYGVTFTEDQVRDALRAARKAHSIFSRTTKKGSGLSDFLSKTANQIKAKADADRRAKIARDIAEKQRKAAEERKRQQEEQARRNQEAATRDTSQGSISYGDDSDVGSNEGVGQGGDPYGGLEYSSGGRIGMQEGDVASNQVTVKEPGFISPDANATDQQEIADDKPMDARQGDFIINAPAAEEAGKQDIQRMINTAITNLQEKGVDVRFGNPKINIADKVKLLVSRNEVYIPAIIAKEIGYDRLKKINNRGKREVQRRQEESQQDEKPQARGFIQKKKGDVVEDRGFVTAPVTRDTATFTVFKNFLKKRKPLRADIENFIDTIPGDKGRLGVLAGAEAPLETSTLPELEAIIQTILNRVNDRTFEFRNVNSVKDIMKQRSSRGTGSKMFMYDGLERKFLRPRIKEIVKNPKVFQAGLDAAENVLTKGGGEPDYEMEMLPPNVFNYAKVGDASKRMSKNPKLKFYKRVGQHDFYERIP